MDTSMDNTTPELEDYLWEELKQLLTDDSLNLLYDNNLPVNKTEMCLFWKEPKLVVVQNSITMDEDGIEEEVENSTQYLVLNGEKG